ncbi:fumarylacetoacetate hydrolase family protein [Actinomycetospora chiangmaiensis]|uniref:fumarylacetoacetate hydrolase family protein n=1 Tax=Actinomycetospora chiangmaiensis TaxID=402650 RepID=UPI000375EF9D|nr:fumarylacetoacetate hydrolase family protein [Actinomycetospora chiangmaiensis]
MKLATFEYEGAIHCGVVDDNGLHALPVGTSVAGLLADGEEGLRRAGGAASADSIPLDQVRLLPPLEPPTVRDFVAFEEHVEGVRRSVSKEAGVPEAWYDAPTFYFSNPYAMVGAHDDVPVPPGSQVLDFELEVAAVIGREGRDLSPEQARDHIVGYTIFNDWSARDLQSHEMQVGLGPAKGKDTATTLGPWLVTADELEPRRDSDGFLSLALTAAVNGRVVGEDLLSNMGWHFEDLVAYASRGTVVRPGDVLGSGTCGNGGCLGELWGRGTTRQDLPPLVPGDVVTLTVEGLGQVSNRIVAGADPVEIPRAQPRPRTRPTPAPDL